MSTQMKDNWAGDIPWNETSISIGIDLVVAKIQQRYQAYNLDRPTRMCFDNI